MEHFLVKTPCIYIVFHDVNIPVIRIRTSVTKCMARWQVEATRIEPPSTSLPAQTLISGEVRHRSSMPLRTRERRIQLAHGPSRQRRHPDSSPESAYWIVQVLSFLMRRMVMAGLIRDIRKSVSSYEYAKWMMRLLPIPWQNKRIRAKACL